MSQAKFEVDADSLVDHQFTAKSLQRQAKKANKDEAAEKNKLKLVCPHGLSSLTTLYFNTGDPLLSQSDLIQRTGYASVVMLETNTDFKIKLRLCRKETQMGPRYTPKMLFERKPKG